MSIWSKLDSSLTSIYLDYLHEQERGVAAEPRHHPKVSKEGRLNVAVYFSGDLAELEALGLETTSRSPEGRASGDIHLGNLEQLAAHPAVVRIAYGREPRPILDASVPDINVRGQIWTLAGSVFSGLTGEGVIIGVIDTGIDFSHPFFRDLPNTTRILRIWDQGLRDGIDGKAPEPSMLEDPSGITYGVEYDDRMINAAVQGTSKAVKHRDCAGHGTHVASIAAGNGQGDYKYVGVAPKASLVVVKYLHPDYEPLVNYEQRFRDAVAYIIKTASALGKPFVINVSLGDSLAPHDGITVNEDFLSDRFAGATGQAFVTAAGNDAGKMPGHKGVLVDCNQHAQVLFPTGGGTTEFAIELLDTRTDRMEYNNCVAKDETGELKFRLYYPNGKTIYVSVKLPDTAEYIDGPSPDGPPVTGVFSGRRYLLRHVTETVKRISAPDFKRNLFEFTQTPNAAKEHYQGMYSVKIATTDDLEGHLYCGQPGTGDFRIDDSALTANFIVVWDRYLIGSYGGAANILTVAAYSARSSGARPVADFSSRGPLASYDGSEPLAKPDLAAPGVRVTAAHSKFAIRTTCKPNTVEMSGTSMATPHVAGAVALLLQKKPTLTTAEIIAALKNNVRTGPPPNADAVGAGLLDVKKAIDSLP
ncbi:MAG TPA: S8 family serine peptidase [Thermoanaerobaculia bacterium]|nr:S8 family serine peptidase [Thermoanaerobaculia bacterium]